MRLLLFLFIDHNRQQVHTGDKWSRYHKIGKDEHDGDIELHFGKLSFGLKHGVEKEIASSRVLLYSKSINASYRLSAAQNRIQC
jgi:hypothetical protein